MREMETGGLPDAHPAYLPYVTLTAVVPMRPEAPDRAGEGLSPEKQAQFQAELAYLRGDFAAVTAYADGVEEAAPTYLCACAIGMSAAISLGDYDGFAGYRGALAQVRDKRAGEKAALYAEAALTMASVSMLSTEDVPEWLVREDFAAFPPEARPWLVYLYAKYLQKQREPRAMLAAAQSALAMAERPGVMTVCEVYLRLTCGAACCLLGDAEETVRYLRGALSQAMPGGFLTPFAETITAYSSELEQCMRLDWPTQYHVLRGKMAGMWKQWLSFHNQYTRENITLILNLQEYSLASMLVCGCSYADAAARMHLSLGRIRNLASAIYAKLDISGRSELRSFIL